MKYGSVCSGVEAASLAWMPLGWECVFVSEVEPFPCAVLQERFGATAPIHPLDPEEAADEKDRKMRTAWMKQNAKLKKEGKIPNEGDFTKIGKKYAGKIDLLVGGTPCQDLSVAGKREGFNGKRSSLAIDFVRLAYESQCKWFVWENVPGVFSSNVGGDFATLLSLFTGCEVGVPEQGFGNAGFVCNARRDRFGVAWRVLDAQFTRVPGFPFAIPQRRRRVFVVGYCGDWTKAAEVCLEPDRLSWNTPARIKTREIFAENAGTDAGMAGGEFLIDNGKAKKTSVCNTLDGGQGEKAGGVGYEEQVSPTIKSTPSGSNTVPDIICVHGLQDPICNDSHANAVNRNNGLENVVMDDIDRMKQFGFDGYNQTLTGDVSKSLGNAATDSDHVYSIGNGQANSLQTENELAQTLNTMHDQQAIVSQYGDVAGTLEARHDSSPCADRGQNIVCYDARGNGDGETANTMPGDHQSRITDYTALVKEHLSVRRLMPVECERLMGFPDNWTRIPWKGKPEEECPDGPRYRACGNSMCVNVMRWIGMRIELVERKMKGSKNE